MVGMKSDYRRAMSNITLAPTTINPWTNPMKRGIVSPAYNAADTVSYKYGPSASIGAAGSPDCVEWPECDGSIGDVDGCHFGVFMHWDVQPGSKVITAFSSRGAFLEDTHIYSYAVDVWRDDTTDYTLIATTGAIAADVGSTSTMILAKTLPTPLAVTLVAGQTYYVGLRVIRKQVNAGTPYITARTTAYTSAHKNFVMSCIPAYWNGSIGSTFTKTNVAAQHNIITTYEAQLLGLHITYTSTNYLEQIIAEAGVAAGDFIGKSFLLAAPVTVPYVIKFTGLVVGDTKEFFGSFHDLKSAMTSQSIDVLQFDAGVTEDNVDHILFATKDASLPLIGAARQSGKNFDLICGVRPQGDDTLDYDLYWQCRTAESSLHSHAVQVGGTPGTRGQLYTYSTDKATMRVLTTTGAYNSLTSIQVGTQPMVLIGDSQTITGSGTTTNRAPNLDRWGALPTQLTKPRIWIMHGESGQYIGTDASGVFQLVFSHATPGSGDGRDLLGLKCLWAFCGVGINDISVSGASIHTDAQARKTVTQVINDVTDIADIILAANEPVLLIGLPPYSAAAADEWDGKATRWYNRALLGLALAWKVPFYNPWPDMVQPGTEGATIPTFLDAYTVDAGLHYSAAGGAVVRAKMVAAIENSTIDLRDAWD
jgi:lysophospholipase L1-like esterase